MMTFRKIVSLAAFLCASFSSLSAVTYLSDSFEYSTWTGMSGGGWTFQSIGGSTTSMLSWVTSPVTDGAKALKFAGTQTGVVAKSLGATNLVNTEVRAKLYHNPSGNDAYNTQFSTFATTGESVTLRCYGSSRTLWHSVNGGAYVDSGLAFITGWNSLRIAYDNAGAAYVIFNDRLVNVTGGMVGVNNIKLGRNWAVGSSSNAAVFDLAIAETTTVRPISNGSITNHANAATSGSIAWNFATYGANNYYVLTSNAAYSVGDTIEVPAYSTLTQRYPSARMQASTACDDKAMIRLGDWSALRDVEVDAAGKARHCVVAADQAGPQIRNSFLHSTKANFTVDTGRCHVVYFTRCSQVTVDSNQVNNAGYPKATGSATVNFYGGGLYIQNCTGTGNKVRWNTVEEVLAAGIDVSGSVNMDVLGNTTNQTGLNRDYPPCQAYADGITGYHHTDGLVRNWNIKNNTVSNSRNNGIHVSGRNIYIENNTVSNTQDGNNIVIGDWRPPEEISQDCTIKNNYLVNCPASGWPSIATSDYIPGTITVSGNTGCTTRGDNP